MWTAAIRRGERRRVVGWAKAQLCVRSAWAKSLARRAHASTTCQAICPPYGAARVRVIDATTKNRRHRRRAHGPRHRLSAGGRGTRGRRCSSRPRMCVQVSRRACTRSPHLLEDDPALIERIEAHDNLAAAVKDAQFVFEAAPEKLAAQAADFRRARDPDGDRHDPGEQLLGHPDHRDRPLPQAPRARGGHPFLESAAPGAAGRGDPERMDRRRRGRAHHRRSCATPGRSRCT